MRCKDSEVFGHGLETNHKDEILADIIKARSNQIAITDDGEYVIHLPSADLTYLKSRVSTYARNNNLKDPHAPKVERQHGGGLRWKDGGWGWNLGYGDINDPEFRGAMSANDSKGTWICIDSVDERDAEVL